MQLTGIDISPHMIEYAKAQARASGLDNARFLVGNITQPLSFPDESFDLVNARHIEEVIPFTTFPPLFNEMFRITRRRGIISITPTLKHLLQDAGCQDIRQAVYITNFSTGTEAHVDLCQDLARTYHLVQPLLINTGVTTQEEVEHLYQQMQVEMQSDFRAVGFYLTVWGKKP
jgi:ubiquinone/menaquinone biosynthesis C-methylase UbiE